MLCPPAAARAAWIIFGIVGRQARQALFAGRGLRTLAEINRGRPVNDRRRPRYNMAMLTV